MILSAVTVVAVADIYVSNNQTTPNPLMPPPFAVTPILSNAELNESEGFNSSVLVSGETNSTMLVLAPGGEGTVPFTVSTSPGDNQSFDITLTVYLGSNNASTYGVQFSVSPASINLSPGQQVTCVLTVTADKSARPAFYMPAIGMQPQIQGSDGFVAGAQTFLPGFLVADYTPACMYLISEPEGSVQSAWGSNSSASSAQVPLPVQPTVNLAAGQTATVIFGCLTTDQLSLNATASPGLTAEFSPSPLNLTFSYCTGKMYPLKITSDSNLSPGSYQLNFNGTLGSYAFCGAFKVAVS